jgi:hypothetical protein
MLPDPPSVDGDPLSFPDRVEAWMDEVEEMCSPSDSDEPDADHTEPDDTDEDSNAEQD